MDISMNANAHTYTHTLSLSNIFTHKYMHTFTYICYARKHTHTLSQIPNHINASIAACTYSHTYARECAHINSLSLSST